MWHYQRTVVGEDALDAARRANCTAFVRRTNGLRDYYYICSQMYIKGFEHICPFKMLARRTDDSRFHLYTVFSIIISNAIKKS